MKQNLFFPLRKNDSGFSFIESIVSLAIISLMAVCIVFGIMIATKAYGKSKDSLQQTYIVYQTDKHVRSVARRVCPPFWGEDVEFSFSGNSFSICWIDGVSDTQTFYLNRNVIISGIELVGNKGTVPIGMKITYKYSGNEYVISCLFSSYSYGDMEI